MTTTFNNAVSETVAVQGLPFVYRQIGDRSLAPLVLLNHLTGVLEDWDPAVVDGLAETRRVIIFDNRGVGASGGETPRTISDMAADAAAFIAALGFATVDLLGFSLGGFIAQAIVFERPELVRRLILAGTGPAGGEGISEVGAVLQRGIEYGAAHGKHPKHFLFFAQTASSQAAADAFLERLKGRAAGRDTPVSNDTIQSHLTAIHRWGSAESPRSLRDVGQPVLIANGDADVMVPTVNSVALFRALPNAQLSIFPNAGHGGIFQYHREFVEQARRFLDVN